MTRRFTRAHRLLRPAQFRTVFGRGIRTSDRFFTVIAAHQSAVNHQTGVSRLGLAISRKAAPRASDRNRIKRIIRESFRLANPLWENNNLDIVVMARPAAPKASNPQLFDALRKHWRRIQEDSRLASLLP